MQRELKQTRRSVLTKLIVTGVIGAVIIGGVCYHTAYTRKACDRAANGDISKLGAALERFQNELTDLNCGKLPDHPVEVGWLVGPYYGWGGTNRKCGVKVKRVGNKVYACAGKGSRPTSVADERYVYRVVMGGGADLPTTTGLCRGDAYGGRYGICYTSSMIGRQCRVRKPLGQVPCGASS